MKAKWKPNGSHIVRIMICLTSVEYRRATISTGTQTAIISKILTISGPRTSPSSIHRDVVALLSTFSVLYVPLSTDSQVYFAPF